MRREPQAGEEHRSPGAGAAPGSPGQVRLCWHGEWALLGRDWHGEGGGHPTPWDGNGCPACPLWASQFGIHTPQGEKRGVKVGEPLLPFGKQIWERFKCPQPTGVSPCSVVPVEGLIGSEAAAPAGLGGDGTAQQAHSNFFQGGS